MKKTVLFLLIISAITACMPDDQSTYSENPTSSDPVITETTND